MSLVRRADRVRWSLMIEIRRSVLSPRDIEASTIDQAVSRVRTWSRSHRPTAGPRDPDGRGRPGRNAENAAARAGSIFTLRCRRFIFRAGLHVDRLPWIERMKAANLSAPRVDDVAGPEEPCTKSGDRCRLRPVRKNRQLRAFRERRQNRAELGDDIVLVAAMRLLQRDVELADETAGRSNRTRRVFEPA